MKKILCAFAVLMFMTMFVIENARADSPVSVSLFNPVQIIHEDDNVKGLRVNFIYGANTDVSGIDLGLVNRSYGTQKGFQFGFFNNSFNFHGLQFGLVNHTHTLHGVQLGLINIRYKDTKKDFVPFINWAF